MKLRSINGTVSGDNALGQNSGRSAPRLSRRLIKLSPKLVPVRMVGLNKNQTMTEHIPLRATGATLPTGDV